MEMVEGSRLFLHIFQPRFSRVLYIGELSPGPTITKWAFDSHFEIVSCL